MSIEIADDVTAAPRRESWYLCLPIVKDVRRSHGLQRGMLIAGLLLTALLLIVALFAPLIAPYGWADQGDADGSFGTQQPPSSRNIWGTTVSGFDVFSRVVWGSRTAVAVIVCAVIASALIGIIVGVLSGYIRGWLARLLVTVADAVSAFPSLLLAIVLSIIISGGRSSAWGGILSAALSITVVFIPQYFRVIRAEAVRLKAEPFVEASKVLGVPRSKIMFGHVLRNSTRTLPLIFTLNCSEAILTLAGLGFLGFGIEPTAAAEWGYDLNRAVSDVTSGIWWTAIFPGLAIVLSVLGITLVGESMNDLNDPRLRTRKGVKKGRRANAAQGEGMPGSELGADGETGMPGSEIGTAGESGVAGDVGVNHENGATSEIGADGKDGSHE